MPDPAASLSSSAPEAVEAAASRYHAAAIRFSRSMLFLLQVLALGQIFFGIVVIPLCYSRKASVYLASLEISELIDQKISGITDPNATGLAKKVQEWHLTTVHLTQTWCIASGLVFLSVSTVASLLLRPKKVPPGKR